MNLSAAIDVFTHTSERMGDLIPAAGWWMLNHADATAILDDYVLLPLPAASRVKALREKLGDVIAICQINIAGVHVAGCHSGFSTLCLICQDPNTEELSQ